MRCLCENKETFNLKVEDDVDTDPIWCNQCGCNFDIKEVPVSDEKSIQFIFGDVRYRRTLMYDKKGNPRYPLDEVLGFRKRQRYSPLVEVKVAEIASKCDYRESSRILKEWTAVDMSHTTVGSIVKK